MKSARRAKHLIFALLMALGSVAISLYLVERMLARVNPQFTAANARNSSLSVFTTSDYLPFTLAQNHSSVHVGYTNEFSYSVKTNSLGYRGAEFALAKPKNEYRILMLGDSTTFGWGVEAKDSLPEKLEARLNEYRAAQPRSKNSFRVINAGFRNGRSPDTFYLFLKKEGLALNPDLIIVNYFPDNDIADLDDTVWEKQDAQGLPEQISGKTYYAVGNFVRLRPQFRPLKYAFPLFSDFHLWTLTATTLEERLPRVARAIKSRVGLEESPVVSDAENYSCLLAQRCRPKMTELFTKFERLILATRELSTQREIPFLVGLLPARSEVETLMSAVDNSSADNSKGKCSTDTISLCEPQRRIQTFLNSHGIDSVSLLAAAATDDWNRYYFKFDGHATAAGNQRFAQGYFDFLVSQWRHKSAITRQPERRQDTSSAR